MAVTSMSRYAPYLLSLLRIVSGVLFFEHGTQKFFNLPLRPGAAPQLLSQSGAQGMIELVGGVLIILGLLTRPTAFILAGDMAFAYFLGHAPRGFYPAANGGDAAILFCFIFFYMASAGPGPLSVDAQRGGRI